MIKQHREMEPGELVAAGSLQHQSVDSSVGRDLAPSNLQLPLFLFAKLPGWKLQTVTLLCGLHPCPAPPSGISTTANCSWLWYPPTPQFLMHFSQTAGSMHPLLTSNNVNSFLAIVDVFMFKVRLRTEPISAKIELLLN